MPTPKLHLLFNDDGAVGLMLYKKGLLQTLTLNRLILISFSVVFDGSFTDFRLSTIDHYFVCVSSNIPDESVIPFMRSKASLEQLILELEEAVVKIDKG